MHLGLIPVVLSECHITRGGAVSVATISQHPEQCTPNDSHAAVSCCSTTGSSLTPAGCYETTYNEAEQHCANVGARLCASAELNIPSSEAEGEQMR